VYTGIERVIVFTVYKSGLFIECSFLTIQMERNLHALTCFCLYLIHFLTSLMVIGT